MDDLDRMFRRLVSVIRAEFPAYLDQPFEVAELYQSVIPYRHHRRELGFETNQDYELSLMRLLAGARGYLRGDARMQERLRQELAGSNPDTSIFRGFSTTTVSLDPESVRYIESPEAARGERRPERSAQLSDEHLVDERLARRGSSSAPEAETVVFRRLMETAPPPPANATQRSTPPQGTPPPPPASTVSPSMSSPASSPPAASAVAAAAAASAASTASPVRVTSTGPTPSTHFTRAADATGDGGATSRPTAPSGAASGAANSGTSNGSDSTSTGQPMPTPQRGAQTIVASGNCHYCGGELPEGRRITFCPHCGQNLTIQHCPACSTELELGWKFCTTCGRAMAEQR